MKNLFMKPFFTPIFLQKFNKLIFIGWIILVLMHLSFSLFAQKPVIQLIAEGTKNKLDASKAMLNFPKTVERYYQTKGFKLSWLEKGQKNANTETAMMLLDCVRQFGLDPQDYHPNELLYSKLKIFDESPDSLAEIERTAFDLLLTDAMITMMNHLHYGKFNPFYSKREIDNGNLSHFNADFVLFRIIDVEDFYSALVKVQPTILAYSDLQKNMQLVLGQYILDSYDYPEANVRKMAINMERLRWLSPTKGNQIQVNIPSYQLKLTIGDTLSLFKVVVGNPRNPTPTFQSTLTRFTVAPEWKVPAELFVAEILPAALKNFNYLAENNYWIYDNQHKRIKINRRILVKISKNPAAYHARQSPSDDNTLGKILFRMDDQPNGTLFDHREKKVFKSKERAITKGCLQIENSELLAESLLRADRSGNQVMVLENAIKNYKYKNFYLKKPVPIAITYLTCEMIDSRLVIYKDIYQKDAELESKLFSQNLSLLVKDKPSKREIRKNDVKTFRR